MDMHNSHDERGRDQRSATDLWFLTAFVIVALGLTLFFDLFDRLILWTRQYESWEVDELFTLIMLTSVATSVFALRRWTDLKNEIVYHKQTEQQLRTARSELEQRVEERTSKLLQINEQLLTEVFERRQIDDALHASEVRYRMLVENSLGLVCTHNLTGILLSVNRTAARMLGYTPEEMVGRNLAEFLAPSVRSLFGRYLERIQQEGTAHGLLLLVAKNGDEYLFSYRNILYREKGVAPYVLGHALDVTAERRAQDELRASETRYRMVSQSISDYAFCFSFPTPDEARLEWLTDSFTKVTGYTQEELVSRRGSWWAYVHPVDVPHLQEIIYAMEPGTGHTHEFRIIRKDGEIRWLRSSFSCVVEEAAQVRKFYGASLDITEEKHVHAELERSERRFRTLIEQSLDVVTILAADGTVRYQSPSLEAVLGYRPEQLIGQQVLTFVHPKDTTTVATTVSEILRTPGVQQRVVLRFRDSKGSWCAMESIGVAFQDADGEPGVLVNSRDITAHRELQDYLRRAKETAEATTRAQSEFLANVSHELRTPLHILLGYTEMLRQTEAELPSELQQDIVQRIYKNVESLTTLVNAILEVTRFETERPSVYHQEIELAPLLQELVVETQSLMESVELTLTWTVNPQVPILYTDPGKVRVVLKHLIANAVKFTNQGGITISAQPLQNGVEMCVSDTGAGIPSKTIGRIFEPFYQVDGSATREHGGVGLGLQIVKRTLDLLGGTIKVESTVGQGSTFRVWIPQRQEPERTEEKPPPLPVPPRLHRVK